MYPEWFYKYQGSGPILRDPTLGVCGSLEALWFLYRSAGRFPRPPWFRNTNLPC